jgi:hypothetical protein
MICVRNQIFMKFLAIALASVCALPLVLSAPAARADVPCRAYMDDSRGVDITTDDFSIRGTFASSNWRVSFWAWEPAYYIFYVENPQSGSQVNLTGFDVGGTTDRPQYQFTDPDTNRTYVVTFRYNDSDTLRLEVYQDGQAIANELLTRESDELIGGP